MIVGWLIDTWIVPSLRPMAIVESFFHQVMVMGGQSLILLSGLDFNEESGQIHVSGRLSTTGNAGITD